MNGLSIFRRVLLGSLVFVGGFSVSDCSAQNVADVQQFITEHPNSLVLFHRPGCPYCQYVMPLFDAAEVKHAVPGEVEFLKVNITVDPALKGAFNFSTVPTFVYYKGGQERFRHGSNNKTLKLAEIEANIKKHIA